MPRTIRSICTPAAPASYSARISCGSTMALHLMTMRPSPCSIWRWRSRSIISLKPDAQRRRGNEQPPVALLARVAGQQVEELGHVGAKLHVGRQQAQVDVLRAVRGL